MNNQNEKVAAIFANLMIERIENLKNECWEKPWFSNENRSHFYPRNIRGNVYKGGNAFLLTFFALAKGYQTPIFMTFKQAKENNIHINKGEKSLPVYFKNYTAYKKDNTAIRLTLDEYNSLTDPEKKEYQLSYYVKMFLVFNLEQTNFADVSPEQWQEFKKYYSPERDEQPVNNISFGMPILDDMLNNKSWVCPIHLKHINKAYFAPMSDEIVVPLKELFFSGKQFYTTLIHEMTHSTGIESRLNRNLINYFGTENYAIEELIAEFSAAFSAFKLGVFAEPDKNNITYLSSWLNVLKEKPKYIFNILDNAVKASDYILNHIGFEMEEEKSLLETHQTKPL